MPIHPPRKDSPNYLKEESKLVEMLKDWMEMKFPHKHGVHFPDYSCCYPKLEVPLEIKRDFLGAIRSGNEKKAFSFQEEFEIKRRAFFRAKEKTGEEYAREEGERVH